MEAIAGSGRVCWVLVQDVLAEAILLTVARTRAGARCTSHQGPSAARLAPVLGNGCEGYLGSKVAFLKPETPRRRLRIQLDADVSFKVALAT